MLPKILINNFLLHAMVQAYDFVSVLIAVSWLIILNLERGERGASTRIFFEIVCNFELGTYPGI